MMKPQIPENKWIQGKPDSIENSKGLWGGRLFTFARLSSTNVWTKKNLRFFRNGDIIITRHQTEGRGRFSRSWFSPGLKFLTLSVVFSDTHIPVNTSQTRVIKKSIPFGSPPFIASRYLSFNVKAKARNLLLKMHQDKEGGRILKELLIDRFALPKEVWYQPVREIKRKLNIDKKS